MKKVLIVLLIILGALIGYVIGDSDDTGLRLQIKALQDELANCEKEIHWQTLEWHDDDALGESDKAMMEVIKKIAEIDSANITIDTPDAHFHIEWER